MKKIVIWIAGVFLPCAIGCCLVGCQSPNYHATANSPVVVRCLVTDYKKVDDGSYSVNLACHVFAQRHPVVIKPKLYIKLQIRDEDGVNAFTYHSPSGPHVPTYKLLTDAILIPDGDKAFEFVAPKQLPPPSINRFVYTAEIKIRPINVYATYTDEFLDMAEWVWSIGLIAYKMEPGKDSSNVSCSFSFCSKGEKLRHLSELQ